MATCKNCESAIADLVRCPWCADAYADLLERLNSKDDGAASWAVVAGWVVHGRGEQRSERVWWVR